MRKYLIGILIGVALTISTSVFANDVISLIGQKIQGEFPVKINGETLEKPAIVINGTSYLPNRAIADALGMDIKFDADLGIELKSKEVSMINPITTNGITTPMPTEEVFDPDVISGNINTNTAYIRLYEQNIKLNPDSDKISEWQTGLKKYQDELAIWEARKAALTQ